MLRLFSRLLAYPALSGLFLLATGAALHAASRPQCSYQPRSHWLSVVEIEQTLKQQGLHLVMLRIDNERCYAARARDGAGALHDLVLHPVTADVLRSR